MKKDNEKNLWDNLDDKNKSYTVSVLHFFHYRRKIMISKSWTREEVFTWELVNALDILPREYFLAEFLNFIKQNKKELNNIAAKLSEHPSDVTLTAHPKLNPNRGNDASDIRLSINNNNELWIEAKTGIIKKEELLSQIEEQKRMLQKRNNNKKYGILALIPKDQKSETTFIYWSDVKEIFEIAVHKLEKDNKNNSNLIKGYKKIAQKLTDRIESFPNLT